MPVGSLSVDPGSAAHVADATGPHGCAAPGQVLSDSRSGAMTRPAGLLGSLSGSTICGTPMHTFVSWSAGG